MTDGIVDLAESLSARASRSNRPVSAVVLAGAGHAPRSVHFGTAQAADADWGKFDP